MVNDLWLAYEMDGGPSGIWWEAYASNDPNAGVEVYGVGPCLVNSPDLDFVIGRAREAGVRLMLHTQEWDQTFGPGSDE